ncbi:MAG: glycoside hydrolase family 15 protein [Sulfuricurvum sp.]|uniref:glycoside hydrolase family 15 protein n=1 Tax=Sulfuricurvum sp. TaxID=2025608 RepID=UPI002623E3EB|nr:glycoside hydrolase family 15 protein [Sulfuricurvum sp.]MDD2829483.1 glycoside hydrolase family 15 protein [Sulfuricurvum sp.]MDD4949520.1 glycoside hydrolase family 15 protein [Sulfuricurvum sp.]
MIDLELLEHHFKTINTIILSRQDAVTGLLPASTAITAHGDYTDAWVRDNVYSIMSVWGLALSYKKVDPTHPRSYLLSQSVVKLMRGLLSSMMRQSNRLEAFKYSLDPMDALHAKYGTHTGLAVVGDDEWGHLQLDATSLYLLMMAQMIESGLNLIYSTDEVDFVQNLVHYISRAYCVPDYGIWERGNKINHGATEINCSSVGMAKAALEAMDGFNLFGKIDSQEGVIHVVPSDIARSRLTLQSLLPRESNSKETDAALLSIIGYPAYAIEDTQLHQQTREKVLKKLEGKYGCKRFLLDGHQSALEDSSRLHYEPSELREFEDIESEWPLFFTYLLLDALIRGDKEEISIWYEKLKPLFVEQDGEFLLPELYALPRELIEAEKLSPGSQKRLPNENIPLVWGQSLFILCELMLDGLLQPNDIDPLNRRGRLGHQNHTTPLVAILAENRSIKEKLSALGIMSETIDELQNVKILNASILSEVHTKIGKNLKLSLSGRTFAVTRTITTSRLYLLSGHRVLFLPYYFNPQGFYFSYDNTLLAEHFRSSLKFLDKHWNRSAQPIVPFLVREDMLQEGEIIVELLREVCGSSEIETGEVEALLQRAAIERIEYLNEFNPQNFELEKNIIPESSMSHQLYEAATTSHSWSVMRRMSDLIGSYDDRIEDALIDIVIRQKRLAVGRAYSEQATFSKPHDSMAIIKTISEFCGDNLAERVLTQEILLHLGELIRHEPELFTNMLTLRTWYFVQLLVGHISREEHLAMGDAYQRLLDLPPHAIYNRLRNILKSFALEVTQLIDQENLHASGVSTLEGIAMAPLENTPSDIENWHLWREQMGMVGNLTSLFYKNVWHLLQQCKGLVIGDKYSIQSRIGADLTLDSTAGEQNFALRIDSLLQGIHAPDYRQLNIEAIESLSRLLRQSPELHINNDLILDVLIGHAVRIAWKQYKGLEHYDEERGLAWESFYKLSPRESDKAFAEAFIYLLTPEENSHE